MEIFLPTLEAKIIALVVAFRFIVFAIMVSGLIAHMASERAHGGSTSFCPLVKAMIIVAAIAYIDLWFPKLDQGFLAIADYVNPGYNENPTSRLATRSASPRRTTRRGSRGPGGISTSRSTRPSPTPSPTSSSTSAR